jgi:hypothetical protein
MLARGRRGIGGSLLFDVGLYTPWMSLFASTGRALVPVSIVLRRVLDASYGDIWSEVGCCCGFFVGILVTTWLASNLQGTSKAPPWPSMVAIDAVKAGFLALSSLPLVVGDMSTLLAMLIVAQVVHRTTSGIGYYPSASIIQPFIAVMVWIWDIGDLWGVHLHFRAVLAEPHTAVLYAVAVGVLSTGGVTGISPFRTRISLFYPTYRFLVVMSTYSAVSLISAIFTSSSRITNVTLYIAAFMAPFPVAGTQTYPRLAMQIFMLIAFVLLLKIWGEVTACVAAAVVQLLALCVVLGWTKPTDGV